MSSKHDNAYKDFFSHKQVVIDFLQGYVDQSWVQALDLSSLQRVNSSYVHEADRQRIGDVVWRLKLKDGGGWVYLYLLLEFQSSVDRYMALRMMVYVGLFYQDLLKQGKVGPDGLLPPVFPAVIYNGSRPWNAPKSFRETLINSTVTANCCVMRCSKCSHILKYAALSALLLLALYSPQRITQSLLSELITPVAEPLRSYLPAMSYFVLDEGRVRPLAQNNTLSTIIQLEQAPDAEQLVAALEQARELLNDADHSSLRQALLAWLESVVLQRVAPATDLPTLSELQEVKTMLAETVTQWTQDWKEEGRQEVLQKAATALSQRGLSVSEIAQALELTESEVGSMLG